MSAPGRARPLGGRCEASGVRARRPPESGGGGGGLAVRGGGGPSPGSGSARRRPGQQRGRGPRGAPPAAGGRSSGAGGEAGATKARAAGGPSPAPATSGSFAGRSLGLLREGERAESPSFLGDTSREAASVEPSAARSAGGHAPGLGAAAPPARGADGPQPLSLATELGRAVFPGKPAAPTRAGREDVPSVSQPRAARTVGSRRVNQSGVPAWGVTRTLRGTADSNFGAARSRDGRAESPPAGSRVKFLGPVPS